MIYFDNSATTKMFPEALDTYMKVNKTFFGNPSSLHKLGNQADALLQQSRRQVAELLSAKPGEIFFTSGGTEGDNWAIKGTALEKMNYGKHIITSSVEHPAVRRSLQQLERFGFEVTYLPVNEQGVISLEQFKDALREDTILVSLMAINNEVGAIQPIQEVAAILEQYPTIHFHVDAVQAVTEFEAVIQHPRIDFLVLSAHKFHGPKGIGIFYKKQGRTLAPLLTGGGQEMGERSTTENVGGIAAAAKALRMTLETREQTRQREWTIREDLRTFLSSFEDVRLFSTEEGAAHILCFAQKGVRGEVMVHAFENEGIYISTTSACSSKKGDLPATLKSMHVPSEWSRCAVRVSFSYENTEKEVAVFKEVYRRLHEKFQKIQ